jgi:hypothetical protein
LTELACARAALNDALLQVSVLKRALLDYADHQSWRCQYRTRYKRCVCGLDELMASLGLEPVAVADPEAK